MVGSVASKWGALDDVVTALLHVLNKHDHLSTAIADLCGDAADRYGGPLGGGDIERSWRRRSREYKRRQLTDAAGVRNVGNFLEEIANRMPKTTMRNVSLLIAHLDGDAYRSRSGGGVRLGLVVNRAQRCRRGERSDGGGPVRAAIASESKAFWTRWWSACTTFPRLLEREF